MNHYTFEDLYVGMKESFTVEITEEMQRSFTNMSGDVNPMHLDKNECLTGGVQGLPRVRNVYGIVLFDTCRGLFTGGEMPVSSV